MTEDDYAAVKRGLNGLRGGSLGRYGFYDPEAQKVQNFSQEACYASLGRNVSAYRKQILYVGFNKYNECSGYHHSPGKMKAGSPDALRVELEWLKMLLDTKGPFKDLLPHIYETNPSKVHADGGFIFENTNELPSQLFFVFIICARLCYEASSSMDTYLWLRDNKHTKKISALIATGFRPMQNEKYEGKWTLFSPSHTYISGHVFKFAYKWLNSCPTDSRKGIAGKSSAGTENIFTTRADDYNIFNNERSYANINAVIAAMKAASESQRKHEGKKK